MTPSDRDADYYRAIARKALKDGYGVAITATLTRINVSGACTQPYVHIFWGRPTGKARYVNVPEEGVPYGIELVAQCRKCRACIARRRQLWTRRALVEIATTSRTWFGTLTFRADRHSELARHDMASISRGQPAYPVKAAQKYMKRLRKELGVKTLRYLLVVENHKSGLPHIHCLIHETAGPITKRTLQRQWTDGFTQFKLVHNEGLKVGRYVSKYLSKSNARVRASRLYGRPRTPHSTLTRGRNDGRKTP